MSSISEQHADEKVHMEVEALDLIRKRTTIPVPEVKAWGHSRQNPLGLGPFLIIEFIQGTRLSQILTKPNSRLLRGDISDNDLDTLYRQMAYFMLQLFEINFDCIGSLPTPRTGASVPIRPLSWKVHDILHTGGVDTFGVYNIKSGTSSLILLTHLGDRTQGFATTIEYFEYVLQQDLLQLQRQPNSICGPFTAKSEFITLRVLQALLPRLINKDYEHGPFKLICDDFGLANLLVRSEDDLTVVGVIDFEWVYSGPAQLFGSAPWWLLQDRPINTEWDFQSEGFPEVSDRYFRHLEIFTRVLEEEESKMKGHQDKSLSALVKWSQTSGAMWIHMLLSSGFLSSFSFPCGHLKAHVGTEWRDASFIIEQTDEVKKFVKQKLPQLERYDEELDRIEKRKALMENGEITREEFVAYARSLLARGSDS